MIQRDNMAEMLANHYGGTWRAFVYEGMNCYMSDGKDIVQVIEYNNTSAEIKVVRESRYTHGTGLIGVPFLMVFQA